jgi:hypothetical protein
MSFETLLESFTESLFTPPFEVAAALNAFSIV